MAFDEKDKNTAVVEPAASPAPAATPATGGYGDYLANKQTPAASAVSGYGDWLAGKAAPMSSAVSGYGDWLATQQKNREVETAHEGAMTYGDYLAYTGKDPVGDYNAKVRQAELDYQKGLATYGQNAERMAKAGLAKSGYGEYLAGEAFAARGAAVTAAQKEAKTAQQQSFATYGEYLEGLKQKEQQEEEIQAAEQEQQAAVQQQNLANATAAVSAAVAGGATVDAAIAMQNGTYDAATLEQVRTNLQSGAVSNYEAGFKTSTSFINHAAMLENAITKGEIAEDKREALLQQGMARNGELLLKMIAGDGVGEAAMREYAQSRGLTLDESSYDSENGYDSIVEDMLAQGFIDEATRQNYYVTSRKDAIASLTSAKEYWNSLDDYNKLLQEGKITRDQWDGIMDTMEKRFEEQFGKIGYDGKGGVNNIFWGSNSAFVYFNVDGREVGTNFDHPYYRALYGSPLPIVSAEDRKRIIPLYLNEKYSNKSQDEMEEIGQGKHLEIGILDNRVVIKVSQKDGTAEWVQADHTNWFTNDDTDKLVVAWFLKHRNDETLGELGRA